MIPESSELGAAGGEGEGDEEDGRGARELWAWSKDEWELTGKTLSSGLPIHRSHRTSTFQII
jgi:hypothetical protein